MQLLWRSNQVISARRLICHDIRLLSTALLTSLISSYILFAEDNHKESDVQSTRVRSITTVHAPFPVRSVETRFDLSSTFSNTPELAFSDMKSSVILAWGWPDIPGNYQKCLVKQIVVTDGVNICSNANRDPFHLTDFYAQQFPSVCWRQQFDSFLKDADGWGFSEDWTKAVIFRQERIGPSRFGRLFYFDLTKETNALWETSIDGIYGKVGNVAFLKYRGVSCIIIGFLGTEACIFEEATGKLIDRFPYGDTDSEDARRAYKTKFNLSYDLTDVNLGFSASDVAIETKMVILACGDSSSRRVRIVKADFPHEVVIELNGNDHPELPKGGLWSVEKVKFVGGKYLIIEYHFGGRGTRTSIEPTEVYDIETWKLIWSENKPEVKSVTISEDGKKMALMNGFILEIMEMEDSGDSGLIDNRQ